MLFGTELIKEFYELCENVKKRIWIVVPFIGSWKNVQRIIGTKWLSDTTIDVKLLTDIRNEDSIRGDTIQMFQKRADIKTLPGLHAKFYIVDDTILFTSANLTGTAFSKRYEFGIFQEVNKDTIDIFQDWWQKANEVDSLWLPPVEEDHAKKEKEEVNAGGLKTRWNLPPPPPSPLRLFKDFLDYLKAYNHFRKIYESNTERILNNLPIYQEIDDFLNYLFHEDPETPSKKYLNSPPRKISDDKRIKDFKNYIKKYKTWLEKDEKEPDKKRLERIDFIQKKLSPGNIVNLDFDEIKKITSLIESMKSFPLNKTMFLNQQNNSIETIKNAWKNLLHYKNKAIDVRMDECHKSLFRFGKSAIRELLAYYYPDQYPVINRNSNCGLRFFGYDIKVY